MSISVALYSGVNRVSRVSPKGMLRSHKSFSSWPTMMSLFAPSCSSFLPVVMARSFFWVFCSISSPSSKSSRSSPALSLSSMCSPCGMMQSSSHCSGVIGDIGGVIGDVDF